MQITSRSSRCKGISAVVSGSCSCKGAVSFIPLVFRLNRKFDELAGLEKGTLAPSHISASTSTLAESISVLKYGKIDVMKILNIFSKTNDQKQKVKVPYKQFLKAKVPDMYFKKSHINFYHFC